MSRYTETLYALNEAEKNNPIFGMTSKDEALIQIAISLSQIVDILRKEAKKSSKE